MHAYVHAPTHAHTHARMYTHSLTRPPARPLAHPPSQVCQCGTPPTTPPAHPGFSCDTVNNWVQGQPGGFWQVLHHLKCWPTMTQMFVRLSFMPRVSTRQSRCVRPSAAATAPGSSTRTSLASSSAVSSCDRSVACESKLARGPAQFARAVVRQRRSLVRRHT